MHSRHNARGGQTSPALSPFAGPRQQRLHQPAEQPAQALAVLKLLAGAARPAERLQLLLQGRDAPATDRAVSIPAGCVARASRRGCI